MQFVWMILLVVTVLTAIWDLFKREITIWSILICGIISWGYSLFGVIAGSSNILSFFMALIPGAALILISAASKESIGYGDGLMLIAISPALGLYETSFSLCIAFFVSGVLAIAVLIIKKGNRKLRIPFMPSFAIGLGVMMLAQI